MIILISYDKILFRLHSVQEDAMRSLDAIDIADLSRMQDGCHIRTS